MRRERMVSLIGFSLRQAHKRVERLGDRLIEVEKLVDWERFRPIIAKLYADDQKLGGRPHTDEVVLAKSLILQSWYNLADEELEYQLADRLSFQRFLGFPENIPDYSTVWYCRERLTQSGELKKIWNELQRQLDAYGFGIKKGVIQDAAVVTADVGKKRQYLEKKAVREGKVIEYTPKQIAHQDQGGSYTVKNNQVDFGYKIHQKCDVERGFIRSIAVSTASLHDSQVNLIKSGETGYRDKGYAGSPLPKNAVDKTMRKAYRGKPLTASDRLWNKRISKKRARGERPFAVIKRVFDRGHTLLKNIYRIMVQQVFNAIAYNMYNLVTYARGA